MTAPCVRPDVSKMQSVRHTPACIPFGGWYVQGVEIAWPAVSGASPQVFPVGISSSCQCKRMFSMGIAVGTAQDQVWHFLGTLPWLRNVSLARLRPCTESWPDFTYIRAD